MTGSNTGRTSVISGCFDLGMKDENLRLRDHDPEELSHYSNATTDIEFLFPFGWGELWGIADRTDFDLTQHQNTSGVSMEYFDQEATKSISRMLLTLSLGADRVALAFLCEAYDEEVVGQDKNGKDDVRTVLRLHPALAAVQGCCAASLQKADCTGDADLGEAVQEVQRGL